MKWHPFFNAAGAIVYIGAVDLFTHFIGSTRHHTADTLLDGIGFMSLLVLSAAVMAFLFFYRPVELLVEQRKRDAVSYLLQTIGYFGLVTLLVLTFVSMQ